MIKYKNKRRLRKIKKFGKKLSRAVIFLVVSYLLSLFSFYLYTYLSQILQPEEKGFLGFAIIGLIAGFIAILVSLVNKRLTLTVVISFFIDCLVDSFFLFSILGIQVIQFLPGLSISMSAVIASWHFLKIKLGLFGKSNKIMNNTAEQNSNKYALARKLLENPNKITMEVFKEACELLQGIDPRIDAVLKEVNNFSRALTGDVLGFIVAHIKTEKEEDEEKKEKVLFFIDLINDIKEEIDIAFVKLGASEAKNYVDHPIKQANHSFLASATTTASSPSIVATIVAGSVIATSAMGIVPGMPSLSKNIAPPQEIENSQEIILPTQTATPSSLPIPSNFPTVTPKTIQVLTYSTIEKTIFVSALEEGVTYTAGSAGTYRFTITGGAYMADPAKGWEAKVMIYKNRQIDWSGPNETHTNWNYLVGFPGDRNPEEKLTREEAEQLGKGQQLDLFLYKDDYLIFIVFDSKGNFVDNSGGMYVQVQKATVTTQTVSPTIVAQAIKVDSGWGHFTRIFSAPPIVTPLPPSTVDYTMIAMYVTVHNNSTTEDRIIGGASSFCSNITFDDQSIYGPDGIPSITIPANSVLKMNFTGARIICKGVSGVKVGDRITVGLVFEKFGKIPVLIEIREN